MSNRFEFVLTDPSISLKPGKSVLVRSRCMQGTNKREGSRRSRRQRRREAAATKLSSEKAKEAPESYDTSPSLETFALVRFASIADAEAQGLLFKAFTYNVINQALTPLDRCVDFDYIESTSSQWLFSDSAFLHSILSASYAVNDLVMPRWDGQPGMHVTLHLRETLALLATKMENSHVYEDEAVLFVVINLALLAAVYSDWKAAGAHFAGLYKIVHLRGGMSFLRTRPKLHFKLDRLDLAWSLSSGKKPFFLHPVVFWEPSFPRPPSDTSLYHPPESWDFRLVNLFRDFQYITVTINDNVDKHARYNAACFQDVLSSLQSRLMHLEHLLHDPIEGLVRLTLLAFLTTTFKVPGRKIPYTWVAKKLEKTYTDAIDSINRREKSFRLWILMVVAISVNGSNKGWLQKAWRADAMTVTWAETKEHLIKVMWIECIHDKPGEVVLQQLTSTCANPT
ncbi:Nn.00g015110.m01.CDS01 [Neocucurbitaria sp. VM-36]